MLLIGARTHFDPNDHFHYISGKHIAMSNGESGDTVRAGRRRPSGPGQPGGRERAEAPRRERPGGGAPGGAGGDRPPSMPSMGPLLGGGGRPPSPLLLLLAAVFMCCLLVFGGQDAVQQVLQGVQEVAPAEQIPVTEEALQIPEATSTSRPTRTPRPATATQPAAPTGAVGAPTKEAPAQPAKTGQTWLVMLYQDADDKILEQDIYIDLNEAERVGSTDRVTIVSQTDRYQGSYTGDGDWTETRRYLLTEDGNLQRVGSSPQGRLGEVNMADGETLVDFITWAVQNYPADRYVLILSDHGLGWPGGWSDSSPRGRGEPGVPLSSAIGDQLYLVELDRALDKARRQTGIDKFELIGMDACLMGHLEVFAALQPHARYAVASQETEPALGWAYTSFLGELAQNPDMDGGELGRLIVDTYISGDQRVVDPQARADFVRQGSGMFGLFGPPSAEQLARQLVDSATLSAVDLQALPELMARVNALAEAMQRSRQPEIAKARSFAQTYTSIFGSQVPASYIDLSHFAQLLSRETSNSDVAERAFEVAEIVKKVVLAEMHGPRRPGSHGISIYFPNSQLYSNPAAGAESYTAIAERFARESLWDDFLAFHYTGQRFDPANNRLAIPPAGTSLRGPGAESLQVSPIRLSGSVAAPGQPVLMSADIIGKNVGYIYIFAGFYDEQANSIFMADTDYLESADTREVNGVYYPVWPDKGRFTLEFEWEPLMFAISDGRQKVNALLTPLSYGATPEEAIYTVEGSYTFVNGDGTVPARLYFSNGVLRHVYGFTGSAEAGAPREIIPQPGDQFTIQEKWLDLDNRGVVTQAAYQAGGTLTFGATTFTWVELDAAVGEYIIGFIVEDLDGNQYPVYTQVQVR